MGRGIVSEYFLAANGVKQGAVLSPVLFCVYIDNMLKSLAEAGVGCFFGTHFVGALAYADDVVILAPTATAMRRLLAHCDDYAHEYNISFNASKSKFMIIVPSSRRRLSDEISKCSFFIGNKLIEQVDSFAHLGHVLSSKLTDDADITRQRMHFINQTNNVICYFNKLDTFIRNKLFRSYCNSFYGCELWSLSNGFLHDLCTAWRKSVRAIWKLPYQTHRYLLPLISHSLPLFDEICRRFLNFTRACVNHDSSLVRSIVLYGIFHAKACSLFGQNFSLCSQRFGCSVEGLLNCNINDLVYRFTDKQYDTDMHCVASFLTELLLLREGRLQLSVNNSFMFTYNELNDIIAHICTT